MLSLLSDSFPKSTEFEESPSASSLELFDCKALGIERFLEDGLFGDLILLGRNWESLDDFFFERTDI